MREREGEREEWGGGKEGLEFFENQSDLNSGLNDLFIFSNKTVESPLDCKEIQPVHSEGGRPWDFFERNDAKAEAPVLWPPHAKS